MMNIVDGYDGYRYIILKLLSQLSALPTIEIHVDDLAMDKIYLVQPWKLDFHIQTINSISQLVLKHL